MSAEKNLILIGTRKGLVTYRRNGNDWIHDRTDFLGIPVSIAWADERDGTWWACLDHGHWGTKLHYSKNEGADWTEVDAPAFPEGEEMREGVKAAVKYLWAMTHAGPDKPGKLLIGTDPGALFESSDNGNSFTLNRPLWDHESRGQWFGGGRDNPGIHSIVVDPRDSNHIYIGISCAGVFESTDGGQNWAPRNKGLKADFLPDPNSEIGQDPHLLVACKNHPDVMWQQNHCGIFKSDDGGANWQDVSEKDGPANFGFAISVADDNPDRAWVVPGISDGTRVAVDKALCVCRTDDGGKTWVAKRNGLPQENCFDIVYRHSLDVSGDTVVFGTTTGNLYLSDNAGDDWHTLSNNLPMVYSVYFV